MTRRGYTTGIVAISIAMMIYRTAAVETVTLDSYSCNDKVYDLDHGDSIEITWEGLSLPSYCRLGVEAPDTSSSTCISIEKFRIYGCVFQIQLYKEDSEFPTHTYDCSSADIDDEYCIEEQKITLLKFTYNRTGSVSFRPNVRLTVKVDAMEVTATDEGGVSLILEVFITAIVIIAFFAFFFLHRRDKCRQFIDCLKEVACIPCALCEVIYTRGRRVCGRVRSCDINCIKIDCNKIFVCCKPRPHEPDVAETGTSTIETQTVSGSGNNDPDYDETSFEESSHPSAAPTDNGWAPPPYVAPSPEVAPPPFDESAPQAPPPSYYDVITGGVSVSKNLEKGGIAGVVVTVIIFLGCVGGCGAIVKNGTKCLCELLREICSRLSDLLSRLCECIGGCVGDVSSTAREPAHVTNIAAAPEPETEAAINLSRGSSMVSLNIDMLEISDVPLDPSAPPMNNSFAPPPYIAPPPSAPSSAAAPDAPPPSYYDVVTRNEYEPPEKHCILASVLPVVAYLCCIGFCIKVCCKYVTKHVCPSVERVSTTISDYLCGVSNNRSNSRSRDNGNVTEGAPTNRAEEPFLTTAAEQNGNMSRGISLISLDIEDGYTEEALDPDTPSNDNRFNLLSYIFPAA
ncbi:uncharacterized protein [Argopecten irradians]|uniref:uncharacterized protein n=1 Tax=Argopecten irradians TaxID=31199 RepID=UPI003712767A